MREFITKKEILPQSLEISEADEKLVDETIEKALNLDASGLGDLRKRIQENHGLIRVFVHPFYNLESRRGGRRSELAPAFDFVEKGAIRHINSASDERTAPLLLLEENVFLEDTHQKIQKSINSATAGVFIIPTSANTGYIDPEMSQRALSGSDWYAKATEDERLELQKRLEERRKHLQITPQTDESRISVEGLVKKTEERLKASLRADTIDASDHLMAILLKGLGVKKIVVGGMYLMNEPKALRGCVEPIVRVAKEQNITVSLSKYHSDWNGRNIQGTQQLI